MASDAPTLAVLQFTPGQAIPSDLVVYAAEAVYTASTPPGSLKRATFRPFAGNADRRTIPGDQQQIAVVVYGAGQAPPHLKRIALVT